VAVGSVSGKKHVRVEELRATVRCVLIDPSFADNARRMSEKMQAYGGASQAARLIERFGQVNDLDPTKDLKAVDKYV